MNISTPYARLPARGVGMLAVGILEALFLGALLFVQADRAGAQTTTPPVVSSITATSTTPTTANITWMTDIGATSQVAYGTTTAYGMWSAYNPATTTSHMATLSGLMASTTYHYQVRSAGTFTATTTSADQTFMTLAEIVQDMTAPVISSLAASATTTSATISWMTNEPTTMQVSYGTTSAYTASSTLNSTLMTSHAVTVSGLMPNTTYHYQARSADAAGNAATSTDQMFVTTSMSTSTATTTPDFAAIQAEINRLWQKVAELMALIQQLIASGGGGNNNGGSVYPPYTPTSPAAIDQNGETVEAGRSINFLGHNFGREEDVAVASGGVMLKTVHADGGGNFSTGSMPVSNTPGTYTYTFTGKESGRVAMATITVISEN